MGTYLYALFCPLCHLLFSDLINFTCGITVFYLLPPNILLHYTLYTTKASSSSSSSANTELEEGRQRKMELQGRPPQSSTDGRRKGSQKGQFGPFCQCLVRASASLAACPPVFLERKEAQDICQSPTVTSCQSAGFEPGCGRPSHPWLPAVS